MPTVGKWRERFAEDRLSGLADAPRPGQPRKITDQIVEKVVLLCADGLSNGKVAKKLCKIGNGLRSSR